MYGQRFYKIVGIIPSSPGDRYPPDIQQHMKHIAQFLTGYDKGTVLVKVLQAETCTRTPSARYAHRYISLQRNTPAKTFEYVVEVLAGGTGE